MNNALNTLDHAAGRIRELLSTIMNIPAFYRTIIDCLEKFRAQGKSTIKWPVKNS
jgi:hypothetical protein